MYSNVMNVRKPRQKSARWILVDFETIEYAEEFKKLLQEKKSVSSLMCAINYVLTPDEPFRYQRFP